MNSLESKPKKVSNNSRSADMFISTFLINFLFVIKSDDPLLLYIGHGSSIAENISSVSSQDVI